MRKGEMQEAAYEEAGVWPMNEAEWLSCTDPSKMLAHLRERGLETISLWSDGYWEGVSESMPCAGLRCIFGNPFRPTTLCNRLRRPFHNRNPQYAHVDDGPNGQDGFWLEAECGDCQSILAWNDGCVGKLAAAILGGGECEECKGNGFVSPFIKASRGYPTCDSCHGTGKTPPNFGDMPILADALEDAGCTNEDVLRHCRGLQRCEVCLANQHTKEFGYCYKCSRRGWLPGVIHTRGCWVLRLLSGGNE